jgi:hypothetical protein
VVRVMPERDSSNAGAVMPTKATFYPTRPSITSSRTREVTVSTN